VREIEEHEVAQAALDQARRSGRWPRIDDAWEAVTWAISHEPGIGQSVTESGKVRSLVSDGARSIGWPTIQVIFDTSADVIVIYDAKFSDAKHDRIGHG
jgi:hypothetical protein